MTTTLRASNLSLKEVHQLLKLEEQFTNRSLTDLLSLEPLTEFEQQELEQISQDFQRYLSAAKLNEGQIEFLVIAPLMRLAGFYRDPIEIKLEKDIEDIVIEDRDVIIKGQFDILAVHNPQMAQEAYFWVLVIEAKNSSIEVREGLAQLLTYAYTSLANQSSVLGLITNGLRYEFVYLQQGNPPTYEILPDLSLTNPQSSVQLLQVFKAICSKEWEKGQEIISAS